MISEAKREVLKLFAGGLALYRNQDFGKALSLFEKALELDPDDGPSRTFVKRCSKYMEEPPANWDGVHKMETK